MRSRIQHGIFGKLGRPNGGTALPDGIMILSSTSSPFGTFRRLSCCYIIHYITIFFKIETSVFVAWCLITHKGSLTFTFI